MDALNKARSAATPISYLSHIGLRIFNILLVSRPNALGHVILSPLAQAQLTQQPPRKGASAFY